MLFLRLYGLMVSAFNIQIKDILRRQYLHLDEVKAIMHRAHEQILRNMLMCRAVNSNQLKDFSYKIYF